MSSGELKTTQSDMVEQRRTEEAPGPRDERTRSSVDKHTGPRILSELADARESTDDMKFNAANALRGPASGTNNPSAII